MPDEMRGLFLAVVKSQKCKLPHKQQAIIFSNALHPTHKIILSAEEVAKAPAQGGRKERILHHAHRTVKQLNGGEWLEKRVMLMESI